MAAPVIEYISFSYSGGSFTAQVAPAVNLGGEPYGVWVSDFDGLLTTGEPRGDAIERYGTGGSILPSVKFLSGKVIDITLFCYGADREAVRGYIDNLNQMFASNRITLDTDLVGPYTCVIESGTVDIDWIDTDKFEASFILKAEQAM